MVDSSSCSASRPARSVGLLALLAACGLCLAAAAGPAGAQAGFGPLLADDVLISTTSTPLGPVRAAFDGSRYLVVWAQTPEVWSGPTIFGRFVDAAGGLAGDPFPISIYPIDELEPAVAFNGSQYLVVWRDLFGVWARVVGTDGTLGAWSLLVSEPNHQKLAPAVASDGAGFLVVWWDSRNISVDFGDIRGQFVEIVDGNPMAVGVDFYVSPAPGHQIAPAIAYGDDGVNPPGYLVTWSHATTDTSMDYDVFGALVDPLGGVGSPIALATGAGPEGGLVPAEVAFDGSNHLVVFPDGSDGRLYARRVSGAGAVLDDPPLMIAESCLLPVAAPCASDLAFGDGEHLVVWDDGARIRGARVDPGGTLLDPTPIDLARSDVDQYTPGVAYGGGDFLVTWELGGTNDKYAQLVGPPRDPVSQVFDLIDEVGELNLHQGIDNQLDGKLDAAVRALDDLNANNDAAAVGALGAFINSVEAQRGHKISEADADALIAAAQAIIDQILGM